MSTTETPEWQTSSAEAGKRNGFHRLALTLRRDEQVWMIDERHDTKHDLWYLTILRIGAGGQWARQRYRYEPESDVLYYIGETTLSDDQFRTTRAKAQPFLIATWQDTPH
jgi:hypothetical protein